MLLRPDKKAVIFKLRNPARITTVIPTAKIVQHKGQPLVAVPWRPDETRVLRNLGFAVPDPMPVLYTWPGRFKPFAHQITTSNFTVMKDRCYILNGMGSGKSITALWSFDYLRSVKQVRKTLIVCPLSTLERTWADEVFKNFPHLTCTVLYGTREKRLKLLAQDSDIYLINHDGLEVIKDALAERPDVDLIILDELAVYRNGSTTRWKVANTICNKQSQRKVWGLTGQPTPKAPTDAWAQCRLITPESSEVPKYFSGFRDAVMRKVTQWKFVPKDNALEVVQKCMQPSIRFALDDCIDLPEQTFVHRDVDLTSEQRVAYEAMLKKLKTEYAGGQILAVNEAVKTNKLVQIALGVAYGVGGERVIIPSKPRMDVCKELVEESEGKAIVFVPLTGALEEVAKELSKDWKVRIIHGETPKNERDEIFGLFQSSDEVEVIVANPTTMSHGLTLTAATTIVWFAPINSNDTFQQANARVRRPGQKKKTVIATIAATLVERRMYARLQTQQDMQGTLLDMIQEQELAE